MIKQFTLEEFNKIKSLVKLFDQANSAADRKKYRQKMQKLGFKMTDFGIKGITLIDFERLKKQGNIIIISPKDEINDKLDQTIDETEIMNEMKDFLINSSYQIISKDLINQLTFTGLYSLRLKEDKILPEPFQSILNERKHQIIYLGKAEGQTLAKRLNQELYAKGHGTFFRSIGAVLGLLPPVGSLIGYSNQNNYKFSETDQKKISKWIEDHLEISIFQLSDKFEIESTLIANLFPLFNDSGNPKKLSELKKLKNKCRNIARGNEII